MTAAEKLIEESKIEKDILLNDLDDWELLILLELVNEAAFKGKELRKALQLIDKLQDAVSLRPKAAKLSEYITRMKLSQK